MPGVHFVGRLATYRYYNMDQVIAQALTVFEQLMGQRPTIPIAFAGRAPTGQRLVMAQH